MENKNNIKSKLVFYLVVSLMFVMPMNLGFVFAGVDTKGGVADSCSLTPPVDVKSSLVLSAVFMCIPGLIEKGMEWREIKCEAAVCTYTAVSGRVYPEFCKAQAAYKECKYTWGEVFAIPPMAILEYARNFVAQILANPVGVAYAAGIKATRKYATTCGTTKTCTTGFMWTSLLFLAVTDIAGVYQTFKSIEENGVKNYLGLEKESNCEDIEDIKEELEELIKKNESE